MTEGMTCYERDEDLCEDQMCLRAGCKLRNERLRCSADSDEAGTACKNCRHRGSHLAWRCDACGFEVKRPLPTEPQAYAVSEPVADTWLVGGRPDLMAMSGDVESDRVIKLHFRRPATDQDRKWLLEAINAKLAGTEPQAVPTRDPDCACCEQRPRKDCTVPGCTMKDAEWALPAPRTLESVIREYAREMRRNSGGSDDYPLEWAKATAEYLETLIERSHGQAVVSAPQPPAGYQKLPDGIRCRCLKMWQDGKGGYWCCLVSLSRLQAESASQAVKEPDAWEWRYHFNGRPGAWIGIDQPIARFRENEASNLENGTYELRPLYAGEPLALSRPERGEGG